MNHFSLAFVIAALTFNIQAPAMFRCSAVIVASKIHPHRPLSYVPSACIFSSNTENNHFTDAKKAFEKKDFCAFKQNIKNFDLADFNKMEAVIKEQREELNGKMLGNTSVLLLALLCPPIAPPIWLGTWVYSLKWDRDLRKHLHMHQVLEDQKKQLDFAERIKKLEQKLKHGFFK